MKSPGSGKPTKRQYAERDIEVASMGKLLANVDRIILLEVLKEHRHCRVTQLAMESGLSQRSVYYHLSRLRKKDIIRTYYDKGRYIVVPGKEAARVFTFFELVDSSMESEQPQVQKATARFTHLRVVE